MSYVSATDLARQIGKPQSTDARLQLSCDSATQLINDWVGVIEDFDPVPPTIAVVALSLAVDLWKQPDATFGIVGAGENGMVRIARDLLNRYDSLLIPFYSATNGWGVA